MLVSVTKSDTNHSTFVEESVLLYFVNRPLQHLVLTLKVQKVFGHSEENPLYKPNHQIKLKRGMIRSSFLITTLCITALFRTFWERILWLWLDGILWIVDVDPRGILDCTFHLFCSVVLVMVFTNKIQNTWPQMWYIGIVIDIHGI